MFLSAISLCLIIYLIIDMSSMNTRKFGYEHLLHAYDDYDVCLSSGGDGGHALYIQADLQAGFTERCDTFESIPLCRGHFKIHSLEVWGIQNCISFSRYFAQGNQ